MITVDKFNFSNYNNDLVVCDRQIAKLYNLKGDNLFVLPCGEQAKTFDWAQKLCSWFLKNNLSRNGLVVALGGGTVGDVVGFAGSIYKRGVRVLNVPTTLLAMVDSAIGGKNAVNLDGVKNAVGTFYPVDTLIDLSFLQTLPQTVMDEAWGEIEKYRLLNAEIDSYQGDLGGLVTLCAHYKQSVVEGDFYDRGARKSLNLGHTVAHGLELTYGLSHGQAVKYGLLYEMKLSVALGYVSAQFFKQWKSRVGLDESAFPITQQVLDLMKNDKKNSDGLIVFELPTEDHRVVERSLTAEEVKNAIC